MKAKTKMKIMMIKVKISKFTVNSSIKFKENKERLLTIRLNTLEKIPFKIELFKGPSKRLKIMKIGVIIATVFSREIITQTKSDIFLEKGLTSNFSNKIDF